MKHDPIRLPIHEDDHTDAAAAVRKYVQDHRDGLWHAARLLGGYDAARRVGHLAEALEQQAPLSRRTRRELDDLIALLSLENVGDPDRAEMGYFAVIDPCDSAVEEICLLTDGLSKALGDMRAEERPHVDSRIQGDAA